MNKVFLCGRLTRDVELKTSAGGTIVARAGIAVDRPYSKDKEADFFNVVAFGKTADFLKSYFPKGARVLLEAHLRTSTYEKNGEKRYSTEIIIDRLEFADGKKTPAASADDDPGGFGGEPVSDFDTPF